MIHRLLTAAAAMLLSCCAHEKVAGGFDDVENPALTVGLNDSLGAPYGWGEIRIYARFQNPFEDSLILASTTVPAGATVSIRDTALLAAMGRAKLRGTPWPSKDTVEFNLMALAPAGEALLGGFALVKTAAGPFRFQRKAGGSITYPDAKGILAASPTLASPVLGQRGSVGPRGAQLGLKSVFIPGSPYNASVGADGSFVLARMAAGRFEVKAVSADAKIYSAADSLVTGRNFVPSDWSEADIIWVE